jgi:hypothetical protein
VFFIKIWFAIFYGIIIVKDSIYLRLYKMINNYKLKFAEKLSKFFSLNSEELLPLIQLAPDNVP